MDIVLLLIAATVMVGIIWLAAFVWAVRNKQFSDPKGDSFRILGSDYDDSPKK
ncbi:MAG: cbb3-type cytochrome oxidase assembly protein CcoS [Albidovulum sp.]|nr:cbb3-type cytochrome oxidase assembly protein CcoS [Albidovulum sp.]MDE0531595.1 cbb3-type cytochrome oxidase assembly protein CcoS [Albidovulum sp.]